jgi:catechol 2,3-dioxygenase-like lactoylglutathione lyase family enzyme
VSLVGLDHIQIAIPAEGENVARRFCGELLGLREVAKPASLAERGGCWFVGPGVHLHLGVEEPFAPARRAHPAFLVDDMAELLGRLEAAGTAVTRDDALRDIDRAYVADPFGNRIELIAAEDAGFTERG